jgi:hypothetical protein
MLTILGYTVVICVCALLSTLTVMLCIGIVKTFNTPDVPPKPVDVSDTRYDLSEL